MYKGIDLNKKHHPNSYVYKLYILSKGKRKPHDYLIKLGKHNLDLVYSDIVGPILVKGYNGN
jgi:hypothetical protein